tara:strand:- start:618 stop:2822 length:2205 start_codon:yes stop_codon:yes gene_type:complete
MANGPLGGFMPTPPSPGQPPQVKLETSAESRGNFNKFLGTLPKNGTIGPIQTGVGLSSPMPVTPMTSNVNIFQPQMSQMTAMPMMPPAQPVKMMQEGGVADFGDFFDEVTSYADDDRSDFSGQEDTSDSFDANMGLSNQEVQNIFGGEDQAPLAFPTPRPEILKDAVSRAEIEVFGGTESDALKFFNDSGGLTNAGQKAFEDSIKGNLIALQEPEVKPKPADGGLQLASLLDNRIIPSNATSVSPGDLSRQAFLGVSPTRSIDTGKGLSSIPDLTLDQDLLQARPDVLRTGTALPAFPTTAPATQRKTFVQSQPEGALKGTAFDFVPDAFQISNFLSQRGTAPTLTSGLTGTAPVGTQTAGSRGDIVRPNVPISRGMQDLTSEDERLIAPEIFGTGQIAGMDENTFRSLSNEAQQKILSDIAGADLGTTFTARDPEPNRGIVPDTALETLQGARVQTPAVDTVLDINTTFDPITLDDRLTTVSPDTLAGIGREQRIDDANTFRQTVPDAARIFGGRQIQNTPVGLDSIVGSDVEPSLDIADIEGNINQQRVADILNNPKLDETFKVGDAVFPNLIATLANKAGSFFDRRLFDAIVSKGLDAVVDPDTGRIIGAKNELGQLIEGRDLEQFGTGDDDNQDPITKFLKKTTEEKEEKKEDEKPPNVIGKTTPTEPTPRPPTVVKSKFPASTASFTPVGFDSGSLNDLIARITGVPAPRTLQEGGVVNAVDNFLTKVA